MNYILSIGSVMSYIWYILIAIFALLLMVMIHEFGHYLAGKMLGFKINEFSVGFGPKIFQKKKKNGELFSLRTIPLGGYCAFDGEDENSNSPTAFNNQKPWKRLIVLFAGAFFNFLSAIIFSYILLVGFGYEDVQVKSMANTSFQYQVENHLEVGDRIYGINGTEFDFVDDEYFNGLLGNYVRNNLDFEEDMWTSNGVEYSTIPLNIERNGKKMVVEGVLQKQVVDGEEVWSFVSSDTKDFQFKTYRHNWVEAIGESFTFTCRWAQKIFIILGDLFTGQLSIKSLGGPVTTIKVMAETTQQSFSYLFVLLPVIAVNLAVFNLLPIPSLDGARMVFVFIEWIRRKPINRDVEAYIHGFGLLILLGFVVIVDIIQFLL
ncbi:MAG: site-2 protease family protein [Clostridia bacterium]|nr:site-2 protease family protein [Clostridia bacterium]